MVHFDRFRFDRANQRLEDPAGAIRLTPKAFDVLGVLIERPGQLVLKDQLLGRGGEIELLEERLARALRGERQVVFVTGEAGAGKTALVEHFVAGVAEHHTLAVTGSQCLEQRDR